MKKVVFVLLLMAGISLSAQTVMEKSALMAGGSGESSQVDGIRLMAAIGECRTGEIDATDMHLSEGFVGPDMALWLKVESYGVLSGVRLYPVPVADVLHMVFPREETYELFLYNREGKLILRSQVTGMRFDMDMRTYTTGTYMVMVIDHARKRRQIMQIVKR